MHDSEDKAQRTRALRERTDEIELIISGLTTFALFSLPGWAVERLIAYYPHMSVGVALGADMGIVVLTGLCYLLGLCFLIHLMTRAYWVGLIGLKWVFPAGIDWSRTPGIGELQREFYRRYLPDLDSAITRADRFASTLFSVIGMLALTMLWIGLVMVGVTLIGGVVGSQFGHTRAGMDLALLLVLLVAVVLPLLATGLDRLLSRRLGRRPGFRKLIETLTRGYGTVYPQRLVLPVQLTLQSNTRPRLAITAIMVSTGLALLVGMLHWQFHRDFTISSEYRYLNGAQVEAGLRSTHYEDQRAEKDRLRLLPMIPSLHQSSGHVPLFVPYHPLRDNILLDGLCVEPGPTTGADCLRLLWAVQLNGQTVSLDGFLASERADLGLRGLTGFVPTTGLSPGMHRIEVTWNPAAGADEAPPDDRLTRARATYSIPFLFAPEFELGLDDSGRVPATSPADESP